MSGAFAPFDRYSADDHGSVVVVFAATACCYSALFFLARLAVSAKRSLSFQADDVFILLSLAFAAAQVALILKAQRAGLGRHERLLPPDDTTRFFKFIYGAQILAVFSVACAKVSVVFLFRRLGIYMSEFLHTAMLLLMICFWFIVAVFMASFQCGLPEPWRLTAANCPHYLQLHVTASALNIVTDVVLSLYAIPGIWTLNMHKGLRITVITLFASRLIDCGLLIAELIVLSGLLPSADITWEYLYPAVFAMVTVHISFITATVPRIHSVFATLQTGQLGARVPPPERPTQEDPQTRLFHRFTTSKKASSKIGSDTNVAL